MLCAKCGGKMKVKDCLQSPTADGIIITRIRLCTKCSIKRITFENIYGVVRDKNYKHWANINKEVKEDEKSE